MKFGFTIPNTVQVKALTQPFETDVTGPDQANIARRAEELGYDMIPIPEHFVVPNSHVELTGSHYFHSTVAQAFIAGATERIRIMSSVSLLPLQHPVIMAKALSTADWLSNGRITATFGVGWDAEEFKVLGVPFHERGRMADEYLAAIVELWTSDSRNSTENTSRSRTSLSNRNRCRNRICRSGSAATPSPCSSVRPGTGPAGSRG